MFTVPLALAGPVPASVKLFNMNVPPRLLLEVIVPVERVLPVRNDTVDSAPFCGTMPPLQLDEFDQLRVEPVVVAVQSVWLPALTVSKKLVLVFDKPSLTETLM